MRTIIQAEHITKSYGDLVLFENLSLLLNEQHRVALVAKNGTGKTSLLNVLAGTDTPDSGNILIHPDIKIGFLEQNPVLDDNNTVINEVFQSSDDVMKAIRSYEEVLKYGPEEKLTKVLAKMDLLEAWDYESRVKQILTRLNIDNYHQPIRELSGGQRKRVALANLLISDPDCLLLDEPTNHLDLESIEWLEDYLLNSGKTILMVTHDRYFLDRVCSDILEIDNKNIYSYAGNYTYFLEKREQRMAEEMASVEKAKNLLRKEQDWMNRMPQARSSKAKYRIDAFYDLKEQASKKRSDKEIELNTGVQRLGKKILEVRNLSVSFDGVTYIDNFSYNFNRFEKVGIIGKNGCGKSTLLDAITGKLLPGSGNIEYGETIALGYYRQAGIQFNENQRVIEAVNEIAETISLADGKIVTASQFLNHFLFTPDSQYRYISKLSGGEKRRLYLCTVLMKSPNFLILDEPTNDLDIMTLHILEDYLADFPGCVIVVSHDRFFMDSIVDHLFVFQDKGTIKDFPGNYSVYREKENKINKTALSENKIKKQKDATAATEKNKKPGYKEKREFEQLGKEIEALEKEKAALEASLYSGTLASDELLEKSKKLGTLLKSLEEKSDRWLQLSEIM
jgi:ABC transport system ATP-binding/permease protein